MLSRSSCLVLLVLLIVAPSPAQTVFSESEPNDSKSAADGPFLLAGGDSISGASLGPFAPDYFRVKTAPQPLGLWRHTLQVSTPFATSIRGRSQTAGVVDVGSDVAVETSLTSTGFAGRATWYGFGRSEETFYRVQGGPISLFGYGATLTTQPVTPINIGTFAAGSITISTVGLTAFDTDLWVYDAAFHAIPGFGNDDAAASVAQSTLTRTYAPGTYYVAIAVSNLANDQASPPDDADRSQPVLDFPDAVLCSVADVNTAFGYGFPVRFTDCGGTTTPNVIISSGLNGIAWLRFEVAPGIATAFIQPPGGGGPVTISTTCGVPNRPYLNALTIFPGAFPIGWLFGLDVGIDELVAEVLTGPPFFGVLDATGSAQFIFPAAPPPGLALYGVAIQLDSSLVPIGGGPPFLYVTQ